MTFYKDLSAYRYSCPDGLAYKNAYNFGWLARGQGYLKGVSVCSPRKIRDISDKVSNCLMMGFHTCEFCGHDTGYGNGEIWLRINDKIFCGPRMVWHYMEAHEYKLPNEIDIAVSKGEYEIIAVTSKDFGNDNYIKIPTIRYIAKWKEIRYGNLIKFNAVNYGTWNMRSSYIKDGFYCGELDKLKYTPDLLLEIDPLNFPDRIEVILESTPSDKK